MKRRILEGTKLAIAALAATTLLRADSQAQAPTVLTNPESERILKDLHQQEIRSLRGLSGMTVVSEIVGTDRVPKSMIDTVVTAAGIKVEEIRRIVVAELNRLQIQVLPEKQWSPSQALLKVKVEFGDETTAKGPHIGLVKLALLQSVALGRQLKGTKNKPTDPSDTIWILQPFDAKTLLYAETWHTQRPFYAKDTSSVVEAVNPLVKSVVQNFVIDYAAAKQ